MSSRGGQVNTRTQVQEPNLGHSLRRFKPLAREGCSPGPFATLMAYEAMCRVTDSSKPLTPFQTIWAPIQTRRNDESFIITDIPV
jgi:hypothetical protein